jgi:cold shock CspA family protein
MAEHMKAEVGQANVSCGATVQTSAGSAKAELGAVTVETPESASPFLPREGIVTTWNSRQGFIARVGHREDLFFHKYAIAQDYRRRPRAIRDCKFAQPASLRNKGAAVRLKINVMGMWGLNFKVASLADRRKPFRARDRSPSVKTRHE